MTGIEPREEEALAAVGTEDHLEGVSRVEREALLAARDPILARMIAEERVETDEVDASLLLKLGRYLLRHRALAACAVALATVEALLMTLPAYAIGLAIDQIAGRPGANRDTGLVDRAMMWAVEAVGPVGAGWLETAAEHRLAAFALLVGLCWMARWGVAVAATYLMQKLGQLVVHHLRVEVFSHITGMDLGYFHDNPVGRLVNRTTFDVQALSELFSDAFAQGLRDVLFLVVLVTVMMTLDLGLAGLLLLSFPLLIAVAVAFRVVARPALRTLTAVQSRMNAWLAENLQGMRENHLYRRQPERAADFEGFTRAHQTAAAQTIRAWAFLRPAMLMISAVATCAVLLVGYREVTAGVMTVGVLLTFLQYVGMMWRPVRNLAEKFNLIQSALASGERVIDVLETPTGMESAPEADGQLGVSRGQLRFDRVRFGYDPAGEPVLRDLSFEVAPGQMLALVGDTGAGKSTIAHLISRFYDVQGGQVLVDGHPVQDYPLQALRRGVAIVPQDVVIFAGTIRDNITLGLEVDEARLQACVAAVCAHTIIDRLPGGLEHVMEEGGRTLSSGERQLLSFARALVFNPPILILDEATANVDTETERLIQQGLEQLTQGRTSIVIAHRLSTIRQADQILVLRHGQIIEQGRHEELLELGGEYARLYEQHLGSSGATEAG